MNSQAPAYSLRTDPRPGDVGAVVRLHDEVYSVERGFDRTFAEYVAGPLAEFSRRASPRERLWLAERASELVGCVAVVAASEMVAQLRWYLVAPTARRAGLGRRLLDEAVGFARSAGYADMILWTESALAAAARLYQAVGFQKTQEKPSRPWGVDLVEEKYEMALCPK